MNDTILKFQCKVTDLVNAMEKYGGVQNVVIETGDDAKGIIKCLLGIIGDDTYYEGEERPCTKRVEGINCDIKEEIILVKLKAEDEDYQNEFVTCVKKLQKLISSTKKGG
jgi:hypothetical protein